MASITVDNRVARFVLVHYTKPGKNAPIEHKIKQVVIKYPKCPSNIPNGHKIYQHFPIYVRPSKIYPNWAFWFEKKPSGNPGLDKKARIKKIRSLYRDSDCRNGFGLYLAIRVTRLGDFSPLG
jgi:hypothetical protein